MEKIEKKTCLQIRNKSCKMVTTSREKVVDKFAKK